MKDHAGYLIFAHLLAVLVAVVGMAIPPVSNALEGPLARYRLAQGMDARAELPRAAVAGVAPPARSEVLESGAHEADRHTQKGFDLAGRGAHFAARADFVAALRILAQSLDTEGQAPAHSQSLAQGLAALRELHEFIPSPSQLEADLDLGGIIARHQTPILKQVSASTLTPLAAFHAYLAFGQERLAAAVGREVAGSMALYGLGKLHVAMAKSQGEVIPVDRTKALVFYRAALAVWPQNYMAANDLGVALAQGGQYDAARDKLEQSVVILPQAAGLHNLSVVYQRLGLAESAQRAHDLWTTASQREARHSPTQPPVEWVDPSALVQCAAPNGSTSMPPSLASSEGTGGLSPASYQSADTPPSQPVQLCQAVNPVTPQSILATDPVANGWSGLDAREQVRAQVWGAYAQGEYVAHARTAHVTEYRIRVDDQLDTIYRLTREETSRPYRLNVGDEIRVESFSDATLNRELMVQPDGTITLRLLGQVHATGLTVSQLCDELEQRYLTYYKRPSITVTPLKVNTKLEDLRATVDRRAGVGGQSQAVKVTPEGTIALPAIGSVPAQGLTLSELQHELNERYREQVDGIEVIPELVQRAPRYVFVLGEVRTPGRFELTGPTTVIQAISMAGGWNVGGNLRQIVIFRRDDDWRLSAAMIDLQAALRGHQACPAGEIWLSDSDVILVPKRKILLADEIISLVFVRGLYGIVPISYAMNFGTMATL